LIALPTFSEASVGSDLVCYLAIDDAVLPLYERVVEGGSRYAIRASAEGLPSGWILPAPWRLEYEFPGEVSFDESPFPERLTAAWRVAAGVPDVPDPLDAFDDLDLQVASLLSLAAPSGIVFVSDSSFGDRHFHEYAAVCVRGRLVDAVAVDGGKAVELRDGRYRPASPSLSPIPRCASVLHGSFASSPDLDAYFPNTAEPHGARRPPAVDRPHVRPGDLDAWAQVFPLLEAI